jgi:uncharacterized protein YecE (DUF72 family)
MIRVGIGGWTFAPWRGPFYPEGLAQARELEFASRAVTAIEINGTFYGTQKRESFERWRDETPENFVFSVKGPRFATYRKVLAEAGPSIERFLASGVLELKQKLGPLLWQLMPTKKFEPADMEKFLAALPKTMDGTRLRHAIEVRHQSFCVPEFVALARAAGAAIVYADSEKHPGIADVTADFVYARLQRASEDVPTGYKPADLKLWADRARQWAEGGAPQDLPRIAEEAAPTGPRDVFLFFISGDKVRAPAAAQALLQVLR